MSRFFTLALALACAPLFAGTPAPAEERIPSAEKPECWFEIRNISPAVYPEEARKREEQGAVLVEFIASEKWKAPKSPKVASTSGFPRLDSEVLRSVRKSKVRTNCPGVQFRYRIVFEITE